MMLDLLDLFKLLDLCLNWDLEWDCLDLFKLLLDLDFFNLALRINIKSHLSSELV